MEGWLMIYLFYVDVLKSIRNCDKMVSIISNLKVIYVNFLNKFKDALTTY